MSRVLFEKASGGFRTVRGQLIKNIQSKLKDAGVSPGVIDGIFGSDTKTALTQWQTNSGLNPIGKVDIDTWKSLMSIDIPSIHDRSLQLTAAFEGHGFDKVVGNFDGAGLTWGIIGFTLLHGELQKIIRQVQEDHPDLLSNAFGHFKDKLLNIMDASSSEQRDWANEISIGRNRFRILPEWELAFEKLGSFPEVQSIQLESVQKYWDIAERDVGRFGLKTEPGFSLCFDIAVQNGGIDSGDEERRIKRELQESPPSNEQDIRKIIANVVAENSNPRWIEDVRTRKLTIAAGKGTVHGAKYNVKTWGIGEFPWQKD